MLYERARRIVVSCRIIENINFGKEAHEGEV